MIRWGIWGTGAIAHQLVSDFPLAEGAVLHAVASRTLDRARRFASQHGAAKYYESLEALLADDAVDAVYIATPNQRHMDDSLACIRAGKAVLCEKPFTLNASQAERVAAAARERRVFCMEAMWTRFIPAVAEAKRLIDAGALGPVWVVQGNFSHPMSAGPASRFDIALGGGALLDLGVYLVSLAHHLLGVPRSARGTAFLGPTGVDEQSAYQLSWEGGAVGDMASSLRVMGTNEFTVFGERGSLRLCDPFFRAHRLVVRSHNEPLAVDRQSEQSDREQRRSILASIRTSAAVKLVRRRMSPMLVLLEGRHARTFPFAGNGYHFEIMEVNRCLTENRSESRVMPLDDTIAVMRTMDELRSQWGLVYPQELSAR